MAKSAQVHDFIVSVTRVPDDLMQSFLGERDGRWIVRALDEHEARATINVLRDACRARGLDALIVVVGKFEDDRVAQGSGRLRNYKAMKDDKLASTLVSLRTRKGRSYQRVVTGEWTGNRAAELEACEREWRSRFVSAEPSAHVRPG